MQATKAAPGSSNVRLEPRPNTALSTGPELEITLEQLQKMSVPELQALAVQYIGENTNKLLKMDELVKKLINQCTS